MLRIQLEFANQQIKTLQDAWINKDKVVVAQQVGETHKPIMPRHLPWRVRQQELEREDRHKFELLKKKEQEAKDTPAPATETLKDVSEVIDPTKQVTSVPITEQSSVEELEKELGVVNEH